MFTHMMVGSNDLDRSKIFYDAVLGTIGVAPGHFDEMGRLVYFHNGAAFLVTKPINGEPASCANGGTIGLATASPEQTDAWHKAGVEHGGTAVEDAPGERPGSGMYLAYLRDPDGNKLCALHRLAA